jgi:hypothetical protein
MYKRLDEIDKHIQNITTRVEKNDGLPNLKIS